VVRKRTKWKHGSRQTYMRLCSLLLQSDGCYVHQNHIESLSEVPSKHSFARRIHLLPFNIDFSWLQMLNSTYMSIEIICYNNSTFVLFLSDVKPRPVYKVVSVL
jgi:hypothetical protein